MSKKKLLTSVAAVVLAATLALGGTFAWQSINQTVVNEGSNIVNPGGRLHDDFNGENKDVYVENFATDPIYTRIRLEEYFKVAVNTGHGTSKVDEVIGKENAGSGASASYDYRIFTGYQEGASTIPACVDDDGTSYFTWTMGSGDSAPVYYMPTFNKNKDSLVADVNGHYNQAPGIISSKDVEGGQYSGYTEYTAADIELTANAIYDADDNTNDEVGSDFDNLNTYVTAENIGIKEETHSSARLASTSGLISMASWLDMVGEDYDPNTHSNYWVYDTDGWVYWSSPIAAGDTTGLLLDGIEMTEVMDEGWYYGLNVVAQFITAGDLGQGDNGEGTTGFYDENSGTAPTANALKLLQIIGVNTDKAKSAEELDKSKWTFTATDNDGDDTNNPVIKKTGSNAFDVTYSGTATEFIFDFSGTVTGWMVTSVDTSKYDKEVTDSTTVIKDKESGETVATWDNSTHKLTMEPGQTLEKFGIQAFDKNVMDAKYDLMIMKIKCIDWSQLVTMRNITSDEYDKLCDATNGDDSIMHWNNMGSITDTAATSYRVIRGRDSADKTAQIIPTNGYENAGFRPAFAAKNPDTDCADLSVGDVVVIGTLNVDSSPVRVPANPVKGGDVTNYDKDRAGVTSKITLSTALKDSAYHMKAVYVGGGLFVCDRVMLNYINWSQISAALTA